MVIVATLNDVIVATVELPAPTGKIGSIFFYNLKTSAWQQTPPSTSLGQAAKVAVEMLNTSPVPLAMSVKAEITDPAGIKTEVTSTVTNVQPAGSAFADITFTGSKAGQYKANLTLYGEYA